MNQYVTTLWLCSFAFIFGIIATCLLNELDTKPVPGVKEPSSGLSLFKYEQRTIPLNESDIETLRRKNALLILIDGSYLRLENVGKKETGNVLQMGGGSYGPAIDEWGCPQGMTKWGKNGKRMKCTEKDRRK